MASRPSDENLRRFAWTTDTASVSRLSDSAKERLSELNFAWKHVPPFAATLDELGSFSEADWRRWIQSTTLDDPEHVEALARLAKTCAVRLGELSHSTDDILTNLVNAPQERLDTELKPWLDISQPHGIAKTAKGCLALRNNDGRYLILGFEDDGTPSPDPPENVTKRYHVDRIQEIVSKYASEPFAVEVEFRRRGSQDYPIIVVPGGVRTPVFAKSSLQDPNDATKRLVEDDAIYVRSVTANNRVSSTKFRP